MRFGIIEDQQVHIDSLTSELASWCKKRNRKPEVIAVKSVEEFHRELSVLMECDVLFFDIQLSEENPSEGLTLAEEIRQQGFIRSIVFITSHKEYALPGYSVMPEGYLLKDSDEKALGILLDKIQAKIKEPFLFSFSDKRKEKHIPYSIISLFEKENHKVKIYTVAEKMDANVKMLLEESNAHFLNVSPECYQKEYSCYSSISELLQQLENLPHFVQINRKMIVNVNLILNLEYKKLTMADGNVVNISSGFLNQLRDVYLHSDRFRKTR